jgi:tRNA(Ile)-lysidine synthase
MQLEAVMARPKDKPTQPGEERVERFRRNLDALIAPEARIGVAVSGGPDSMALLLLSAAARPGLIEAATVDHSLREGSRDEAEMVARCCEGLGVAHRVLTVEWDEKPVTAIQERARRQRYGLLGEWALESGFGAIVTAHHADDQTETLLMRLVRGAGVRGLSGMRPRSPVPGAELELLRPLLGWRRSELVQVCDDCGVTPAADPSNEDGQFERVRVRKTLADAEWLDASAIARSAANLAQADAALHWATDLEWARAVKAAPNAIVYRPTDAPREIRRRIARRSVLRLAIEGRGADLRGKELDRLLHALMSGGKATLRGVLCSGGPQWRFQRAPARRVS